MIRKMCMEDLVVVDKIEKESFSDPYRMDQYEYELNDSPVSCLYVYEKDGKEYFHSGAVFVTDYYVYWYSYTTLAEDENSRLTANKILSSIKVKRPIFKK